MIYQMHKDHGRHMAETPQEAELNRKNGWKDVTREEFYADISKKPSVSVVSTAEEGGLSETGQEDQKENGEGVKRRGRPPLDAKRA